MFQHVRQHMPVRGCGRASAATARKLIASAQGPSSATLRSTLECNDYGGSVTVVHCRSQKTQMICGVVLQPGQNYFMVRSPKFTTRWYLITKHSSGVWQCSLKDMLERCQKQVSQFIASKKQELINKVA